MTSNTHIEPAPAELWRHGDPTATEMWRFLQHVNAAYSLDLNDYPGLYKWSVDNVADFWKECWHFVGIKASQPFAEVGLSHNILNVKCVRGVRLNQWMSWPADL